MWRICFFLIWLFAIPALAQAPFGPGPVPTGGSSGGSGGLNQLTGDVTAGPGTGSQAASLANTNTARTNLGLNVNGAVKVTTAGAASQAACGDLSNGAAGCSASLPLSVANGGSGTASPGLVAGSNVTISGAWPNQTVAASGGTTTITAAPGLGSSQTTFNGTGAAQTVTNGSTLYSQLSSVAKTANYVLNADCSGGVLCDTARAVLANAGSSIQFTAPNPAGTLAPYQMGDQSGHGYTVVTVGATATFFGCVSGSPTSLTVPANFTVSLLDQGSSANSYLCVYQAQNQGTASQQNIGTSGGNLGLLNANKTDSGNNTYTGSATFGEVIGGSRVVSGATDTLSAADCGGEVVYTSGSAVTATTFSGAAASGKTCAIALYQHGAGLVTVSDGSGATHVGYNCPNAETAGQYAVLSLHAQGNNGSEWNIGGQCQ